MKFVFAGHNTLPNEKGTIDPGAVGINGRKEAAETVKFRKLVAAALDAKKAEYKTDRDDKSLQAVINSVKTGTGSVICDCHFNASDNPKANGIEVIIPDRFTREEYDTANKIVAAGVRIMGMVSRGVKTEKQTARKSLAIMRLEGINVLIEICFISNEGDMAKYDKHAKAFAEAVADILIEADALFS